MLGIWNLKISFLEVFFELYELLLNLFQVLSCGMVIPLLIVIFFAIVMLFSALDCLCGKIEKQAFSAYPVVNKLLPISRVPYDYLNASCR